MTVPLTRPQTPATDIRRVAILFSGGPAPGANSVISTAADAFLRSGIDVVGVKHGYSQLMQFGPDHPMQEGRDYLRFNMAELERLRTQGGIKIGTARANPGKKISAPEHLEDSERTAPMKTVHEALCSLDVDALISIGGDDTLKTANKFALFQEHLPSSKKRIKVVHIPKTIDNDYSGIDFTFGYFTAVEVLSAEIRNLVDDAASDRSYFIVETMGRSAGWLAYGAAIAGGASLVISVEDIVGKYATTEKINENGISAERKIMKIDELINRIVATMRAREKDDGKRYGVICVAEGLAELLPADTLKDVPRDAHGHISIGQINLSRRIAERVEAKYAESTGQDIRVKPIQLGYESRCAPPHAFDVMLGSQLGVGAYRALVEEKLSSVMISVEGQLKLGYVPFKELVDPDNLVTVVRFIETDSDFHQLARFLESHQCGDLDPQDVLSNR
ncbi:6-phosphofructokinase [Calycomorphotria hydatis]|uniref:Pyrophosphate--fructose 6-phosphate 1-phosphotransferase n=1 Tax=Calycomorphotria hydatis TaxID=2528027 RepID=A0A517T9C6_9PLAN|nr:6-phosphofructokinase [Calycomorphotria hydatis]QDT64982.1 Pyrophosphate--fructose 6-phosphate 1-phosphotransferase [Calycomorphotria hydatis]